MELSSGLWIATAGDMSALPSWIQGVLSFLSLFAADLNFSQPGCSGISTYAELYAVNLGGMCSVHCESMRAVVF